VASFIFIVIEYVEINPERYPEAISALLLLREQIYLNWLFSLPAALRSKIYIYIFNFIYIYIKSNFNQVANLPPSRLGNSHSLDTKERISASMKGITRSDETRAKRSMAVLVHDLDGVLVGEFPSMRAAALWLKISVSGISRAVNQGVVLKVCIVYLARSVCRVFLKHKCFALPSPRFDVNIREMA
jgi:hypothetical protein